MNNSFGEYATIVSMVVVCENTDHQSLLLSITL